MLTERQKTGHKPTTWPSDGEVCRYCGAWSDEDWAKPCPQRDNKIRAFIDAKSDRDYE